ncbi:hypothetical protein [Sphingobium chungbukense]|uniref:Uncharacterized protein n=1 Tax=Sphingobium chungbukense TaxID=56193 RepID=A0A0M3AN06_9SPHN|nr:hypothetical protein [Sphingobium chungbukense]KKW90316.1 hypothetical protein YP76_20130 [Sphingobium chungbukense]
MTILFRIMDPADNGTSPTAVITARQLATFRRYLRAEGDRLGIALLDPDEYLGNSFEVRVCPLALAAVTRPFDHDPAVIAVIEEAQFRGRRVSVHHSAEDARITLGIALTSDQAVELDLAYGNAYALLEALAIEAESVGDIAVGLLRARLSDPATPSRATLRGVDHYLPRLERLIASAGGREDARIAWA